MVLLEAGDWCPAAAARVGDLKEVQGLFDRSLRGDGKDETGGTFDFH